MTRITLYSILYFWLCNALIAQNSFTNPILPGSYPDPSICRVGDTFYMVNSSFEYYPGLPIHKSKDLVNWELIGYGIHRTEQATGKVNLVDVQSNGGIHAPTIRYHKGLFYIITTNVYKATVDSPEQFVNFIITAKDAEGPWSLPKVINGAPGIDPDLFFDDNGRVWYTGQRAPKDPSFPGEGEIWIQELDLKNWNLIGERYALWRGACGGVWVEGPHIYKEDGRYYLMVAEGGTGFEHAIMIAVSDKITGPYTSNPRNPILTSRNLSYDNWVNSTGHGDLVKLEDGNWYMVILGVRGEINRRSNMGRETHLVPVKWESEPEWNKPQYMWPVVAPETGRVLRTNSPFPIQETIYTDNKSIWRDDFNSDKLNIEWNFRRVPNLENYDLKTQEGFLRIYPSSNQIAERKNSSLLGIRQRNTDFSFKTSIEYIPVNENDEAGVIIFQKDDSYISFTITRNKKDIYLSVHVKEKSKELYTLKTELLEGYRGKVMLHINAESDRYHYKYSFPESEKEITLAESGNDLILCEGYTGAYIGFYNTSNGKKSDSFLDVDWIEYNY